LQGAETGSGRSKCLNYFTLKTASVHLAIPKSSLLFVGNDPPA
jgi:hypothetical protein